MRRLLLPLMLAAFTVGCGANKSDATDALLECATPGEIDEATLIAWDFEQSIHEMVQCGNLSNQLSSSLYQSAATLLFNPAQAPEAFSYSDGKFRIEQDDVTMTLTLTCGPWSLGCPEGDTIDADPFLVESYLEGAEPEEFDGATLVIPYSQPGPLVKLLGKGANPPNPLRLTAAEVAVFVNTVQQLRVNTVIDLDTPVNDSTVTYSLKTGRVDLEVLQETGTFEYELKEASASRGDQTAEPTLWDVTFEDGALSGDIELEVLGGDVEYTVSFAYGPASMTPLVEFECLASDNAEPAAD
jgi:hypothetical protein